LSAKNLGGFPRPDGHKYRIFTSTADAAFIRDSASYQALASHVCAEIIQFDVDELSDPVNKFVLMTRFHLRALREAKECGAIVVFLGPDLLIADGSLTALQTMMDRRAVLIAAPRLNMTTIVPEIRRRFANDGNHAITISPRQLVSSRDAAPAPHHGGCILGSAILRQGSRFHLLEDRGPGHAGAQFSHASFAGRPSNGSRQLFRSKTDGYHR